MRWVFCKVNKTRGNFLPQFSVEQNLDSIESLAASREQMNNPDVKYDEHFSSGFVTEMRVNMKDTVKEAGLLVSKDYVKDKYFGKLFTSPEDYIQNHPLNNNFRPRARANVSFCFNLNELDDSSLDKFFSAADEKATGTKFYAVFDTVTAGDPDTVYENAPEGDVTAYIEENKIQHPLSGLIVMTCHG